MIDKNEDVVLNFAKNILENTNQSTMNENSVNHPNKNIDYFCKNTYNNNQYYSNLFHDTIQEEQVNRYLLLDSVNKSNFKYTSTIKDSPSDYNHSETNNNEKVQMFNLKRKREKINEKSAFTNSFKYKLKNDGEIGDTFNDLQEGVKYKEIPKSNIIICLDEDKNQNEQKIKNSRENHNINLINRKSENIVFNTKVTRSRKSSSFNQGNKIKNYCCEFCQEYFNSKKLLDNHLSFHKREKKKEEKENSKSRKVSNEKIEKIQIEPKQILHKELKIFRCPKCDYTFTKNSIFQIHMRIHNNEKPYSCTHPGCYAKFIQYNNFLRHLKSHSEENKKKPGEGGGRKKQNRDKNKTSQTQFFEKYKLEGNIFQKLRFLNNMALDNN